MGWKRLEACYNTTMKKIFLLIGGILLLAFATFFVATGYDELWSNGQPWIYGFAILIILVVLGVSAIIFGMKEKSFIE